MLGTIQDITSRKQQDLQLRESESRFREVVEAIRMVRAICWKPGIKDGRRVRTVVPVEILFRLP